MGLFFLPKIANEKQTQYTAHKSRIRTSTEFLLYRVFLLLFLLLEKAGIFMCILKLNSK